jgi:hypothetical protein
MNWKLHKFTSSEGLTANKLYPAANLLTDLILNFKPNRILEVASSDHSLAAFINSSVEFYSTTAVENRSVVQIRHTSDLTNLPDINLIHIALPATELDIDQLARLASKAAVIVLSSADPASESTWQQYDQIKAILNHTSFVKLPGVEVFTKESVALPMDLVANDYYQTLHTGLLYHQINSQLQSELTEQKIIVEELKLGGQNLNARIIMLRDDLHRQQTLLKHPAVKLVIGVGRSLRKLKRKLTH